MQSSIIIYVLASLSLSLSIHCARSVVRQTVNGPVQGIEMVTSFGEIFYAFKSIPYAKTPITGIDPHTGEMADRRFKV